MYDFYIELCNSENQTPMAEHYYRHIFNTRYNLHFHPPRKDTCKKCDLHQIKIKHGDITDEEKLEYENHLKKAEKARKCMRKDKERALRNSEHYVCSIDLQKALPFPILTVSDAYYKRNLYCYNLGVHDLATDCGYFYMWDETMAARGSQEISSCLIKHIKIYAAQKKKITIYSDTCTGQNRNIKMSLALMKLVQSGEIEAEIIEQKFLVSGHSFLPNDADFGNVEQSVKGKTIYIPKQWYESMALARRKKKFIVNEMTPEDFRSTSLLERSVTRRNKNQSNRSVNWPPTAYESIYRTFGETNT